MIPSSNFSSSYVATVWSRVVLFTEYVEHIKHVTFDALVTFKIASISVRYWEERFVSGLMYSRLLGLILWCSAKKTEALFSPETLLPAIFLTARYPRKPEDHIVRTINFAKDFSLRIVKDILV